MDSELKGVGQEEARLIALQGEVERLKNAAAQETAKRMEAERVLRENDERYRLVIEQSPDAIGVHDLEGRIIFINQSWVELLGAKGQEEILGKNVMDFVEPCQHEQMRIDMLEAINEFKSNPNSKKTVQNTLVRVDGSKFYGEVRGLPFIYMGCLAILVIVRDITERKVAVELKELAGTLESLVRERTANLIEANLQLKQEIADRKLAEEQKEKIQAQMFQAQKMEVVGRLASGIAHDFNNMMTIVKTLSVLAKTEAARFPADHLRDYLEQIIETTDRATSITRQLLIFTKNQPVNFSPVNLNIIVEEMLKILKHLIGENIEVRTSLAPDIWITSADKVKVEQILLNLVINARDSISSGGMIHIKTGNVLPGEMDFKAADAGSRFVRLTVEDSGGGIEKDAVEHLFEPFFSTKNPGKGIGLGLTVVKSIVNEHNGFIIVESEPERGSVFNIYLPASEGAFIPEHKVECASQAAPEKGGRVLLVEDERMLRLSLKIVLQRSGYSVLQAANSKEALSVFERENGGIDLVFTDVVLTDGSGVNLVKELLDRKPGLKVLFASGYMDIMTQWPYIHEGGFHFLQKPYDPATLISAIRGVLEN